MGYVEGVGRTQATLFPRSLDEYITADNPVRFIDAFVAQLDLFSLGFERAVAKETGRPPYDPRDLLRLYIYGYLYHLRSSRVLERECVRNVEVMWLLHMLGPDFKTIADFRKDNREAIRKVCREFTEVCRKLDLFSGELVAVDSSSFKAVNNPARNFTEAKLEREQKKIAEKIEKYLMELDRNDRETPAVRRYAAKGVLQVEKLDVVADRGYCDGAEIKRCVEAGITPYVPKPNTSANRKLGLFGKDMFRYDAESDVYHCPGSHQLTYRFQTRELGRDIRYYSTDACRSCVLKPRCTRNRENRRITRWVDEHLLEQMQHRLSERPEVLKQRQQLSEHPFGILKHSFGFAEFLMRRLPNVRAEMSLSVLAFNLRRAINILGVPRMIEALAR